MGHALWWFVSFMSLNLLFVFPPKLNRPFRFGPLGPMGPNLNPLTPYFKIDYLPIHLSLSRPSIFFLYIYT